MTSAQIGSSGCFSTDSSRWTSSRCLQNALVSHGPVTNGNGRSGRSSTRRIEFADDVLEHSRRDDEHRTAIAAVGRMTDAIRRSPCEEHRLIDVRGRASPAEVLAKCSVPHQHNIVAVGLLLGAGPTPARSTGVVAHLDDRTLIERSKREREFGHARHAPMLASWASGSRPLPIRRSAATIPSHPFLLGASCMSRLTRRHFLMSAATAAAAPLPSRRPAERARSRRRRRRR